MMYSKSRTANINYWKNELKQYLYLKHWTEELEFEKIKLLNERDGLPIIDYAKEWYKKENNPLSIDYRTILDEKIGRVDILIKLNKKRIELINKILSNMDYETRKDAYELYCCGRITLDSIALRRNESIMITRMRIDSQLNVLLL